LSKNYTGFYGHYAYDMERRQLDKIEKVAEDRREKFEKIKETQDKIEE